MNVLLGLSPRLPPTLAAGIRSQGHVCELAESLEEIPSILRHGAHCDVVLIAVAELRREAMPVLREMRLRGLGLPVVILAPQGAPEDEEAALHAGADDVLTRAMPVPLLLARLAAALRRAHGHASAAIACGNVVLDQGRQEVAVDGRPVHLSPSEFGVLEALMLRPGRVQEKEQLLARLYGAEEMPGPRILDVFICRLRRKLSAAGAAEMLRTVWGSGYKAEEPSAEMIAAARARHAAKLPRPRRAHLAPGVALGLVDA